MYVYEWYDDGQRIWGYGCDGDGIACRLRPRISPGLFVLSTDVAMLEAVCAAHGYSIAVCPYLNYYTSSFFVLEQLLDPTLATRHGWLVKVCTPTVTDAQQLHRLLGADPTAYRYACITHYNNVTLQLMFELLWRQADRAYRATHPDQPPPALPPPCGPVPDPDEAARAAQRARQRTLDTTLPETTLRWFDVELSGEYDEAEYAAPVLPLVTFDLETVSSDPHRVPLGDEPDDRLFSASIHHSVPENRLYTLVLLPVRGQNATALQKAVLDDGYDVVPDRDVYLDNGTAQGFSSVLECFSSERALVERTMELLCLGPRLHILSGYNSVGYDMPFLMARCAFYGLTHWLGRFVWAGYCALGAEQIHLDLSAICRARYKRTSYTLDSVARTVLDAPKTGVQSVLLRHLYAWMERENRILPHAEQTDLLPSVRDALHYNNVDTLLVSRLVHVTDATTFALEMAGLWRMPLSTLNANITRMQAKTLSSALVVGLSIGVFFAAFHSSTITVRCPVAAVDDANDPPLRLDTVAVRVNQTARLNEVGDPLMDQSPRAHAHRAKLAAPLKRLQRERDRRARFHTSAGVKFVRARARAAGGVSRRAGLFPGGVNFCLGLYTVVNVQAYDYLTAYPRLMVTLNMSDETVAVVSARLLAQVLPFAHNVDQFRVFDYLVHHGHTTSDSIRLVFNCIYGGAYCGGEFPLTREALQYREDRLVILVWSRNGARRGILSEIVDRFNAIRADHKQRAATLDTAYALVVSRISQLEQEQLERQYEEEAAANGGEAEDEEMADEEEEEEDEEEGNWADEAEMEGANGGGVGGGGGGGGGGDTSHITPTINPLKFTSARRFLSIDANHFVTLHEPALRAEPDEQAALHALLRVIRIERDTHKDRYLLDKAVVSSVYGCIGKLSPHIAAAITCVTRSTLLASAAILAQDHTVLYIDTDSIMVTGGTVNQAGRLNAQFPLLELGMKVIPRAIFVKRKTYLSWLDNGDIKYLQNVNGPRAWRDFVTFCAGYRSALRYADDIQTMFEAFFRQLYQQLDAFTVPCEDFFALFTYEVKVKSSYKTNTVASRLRDYLLEHMPAIAALPRYQVYYLLTPNNRAAAVLRPVQSITSVHQLDTVNLFKHYQPMLSVVASLVESALTENNAPHTIHVPVKTTTLHMLSAFMTVYDARYQPAAATTSSGVTDAELRTVSEALAGDDADDGDDCGTLLD